MRLMLIALPASVLSFAVPGCTPDRAIPSNTVPHRLSQKTVAKIWVRTEKGDLQEQEVEIPAGWWLASPELIDK